MNRIFPATALFALAFGILIFCSCTGNSDVDLIVYDGNVYTVDSSFRIEEAFAVKDGKIVEVGKSKDIMSKYKSKNMLDVHGRPVFPGFIDAHAHFFAYAMGLQRVDLVGTSTWQECVDRLKKYRDDKHPAKGEWIRGRGWDQNDWPKQEFPTKEILDKEFPDNPIYLSRVDGHAALVNQAAIDKAGIKPDQKINGGVIETKNGQLTGILVDNATELVETVIPVSRNAAFLKSAFNEAQQNCFEVGLTTLEDCGLMKEQVDTLDALQKRGDLKMNLIVLLSDAATNYDYYLGKGPYKTDRLDVNGFKLYADGALGSRGACLLQPYLDKPGWYGFLLKDTAYYRKALEKIFHSGFQACTHAIGDSGNRMILHAYAAVLQGKNDRRWRIEHAQVINQNDFEWFGKYNIIPSVQPTHATSDMYWAEERLGPERVKGAYANKQLLMQNGWIALGTDFPVEDISPFKTFYAAVARQDAKNFPPQGFQRENALNREQALRGMTIWAAKAGFEEKEKGSLEKGKAADFVILGENIMDCPLPKVLSTKVMATYINGEKVFERAN